MVVGSQTDAIADLTRQVQQLIAEMQQLRKALEAREAELREKDRLIAALQERAGAPMQQ